MRESLKNTHTDVNLTLDQSAASLPRVQPEGQPEQVQQQKQAQEIESNLTKSQSIQLQNAYKLVSINKLASSGKDFNYHKLSTGTVTDRIVTFLANALRKIVQSFAKFFDYFLFNSHQPKKIIIRDIEEEKEEELKSKKAKSQTQQAANNIRFS